MYKLKDIYCTFFLVIISLSSAQTLQFDNYTTKDGLISDEVYKIFQDKKGYLWLFTNYGAMKYNGKTFEQVLKNLPFNESFIYSFHENDKGQLWVANSNAKIYSVRNDSAFIVKGTESVSTRLCKDACEIIDLYVDTEYNILITTKLETLKLNKLKNYSSSNLIDYNANDSVLFTLKKVNNKLIYSINADNKSKFAKNNNGYFYVNYFEERLNEIVDPKILKFKGENAAYNPRCFKQFEDDIYFSFHNQVLKISKNQCITYMHLNSFILNYTIDKSGHLWVGTLNDGLYEVDKSDTILNHYLPGKTINHVLVDSQNGIWVTSDGDGIFHCKNPNEIHFNDKSLFGDKINFIKKVDNEIFFANSLGDIFILKSNQVTSIKSFAKAKSDVLDIIKYRSGFMICYRFDMEYLELRYKIERVKLPLLKPAFYPLNIFNLNQDTILCISRNKILFLNNGITSMNNENEVIQVEHKILSSEYGNNKLLFATEDGVFELVNNQLFQPSYLKATKNCKVVKIVKDVFGEFWFCTKGNGIFKLTEKNKLLHYTIENGLPSNIVNSLSFGNDNSILLSTNVGLFRSSKFKKWLEVYPEQVYAAIEFKNEVYFITKDGLIVEKNIRKIEQKSLYFNLAKIFVNNAQISKSKILDLSYDQNSLEFKFDIISFSANIPYINYELKGEKNQITISKNQNIILQNLKPGNYTLTASLVNLNNKTKKIAIEFKIIPAFWQTKKFIFSCILCFTLLCAYFAWYILKYLKNKKDKKNEVDRLITEYKLIALKAQINPHFMSNCLTAIQYLILSNKFDEAIHYLAKFSFLVRKVLEFSSKDIVSVKEELSIIEQNIELEQLRFDNAIDFSIEYNDDIDINSILIPPLILQPIIENAVWHGLLPLKGWRKNTLTIKIIREYDLLYIIIEDNGVGRSTAIKDFGNLKQSKGIEITKQRIFSFNSLHHVSSGNIEYEDLCDDKNTPLGTRVKITLPIITEYE